MIRSFLTIFVVALLLTATASAADLPGSEAAALLRKIQATAAARQFPQEYQSVATTVDRAEKLALEGDPDSAAKLFSLAVLKGEILLERLRNEPLPPPTETPLAFHNVSSAGDVIPAATAPDVPPLAEPVETVKITAPEPQPRLSARIVGGEGIYVVKKKETLRLAASRLGVRTRDLARMNRLKTDAALFPGQRLRYNNRRIVPKAIRNGILVNIPERNLYLFRNGRVFAHYPVAVGIAKKGDSTIWRTPTGRFKVIDKKENPAWRIPLSIQKEMEENGEEVVDLVPPGPKNPLGKFAMRTTLAGIMIHSTTRPASINSNSSHGCIRVMPEHMEELFKAVAIPTDGEIIYQPVKVEVTGAGKVYLEVNSDSYEKVEDLSLEVKKVLQKHRAADRVSWLRVNKVINEKSGIAEDVTLPQLPD